MRTDGQTGRRTTFRIRFSVLQHTVQSSAVHAQRPNGCGLVPAVTLDDLTIKVTLHLLQVAEKPPHTVTYCRSFDYSSLSRRKTDARV